MVEVYRQRGKGTVKFVPGCGTRGIGIISFYGCNFACPFCFAQKYSYATKRVGIDSKGRVDISTRGLSGDIVDFVESHPNVCYLQLTGGEPILSNARADETIRSLAAVDDVLSQDIRVIYQTNGLVIGNQRELPDCFDSTRHLNHVKVLFEISLKGTNEDEFRILSGRRSRTGFKSQLRAYWMLRSLCSENVNVVTRLGVGHHRKTIHFVDPSTRRSLFQRQNWAPEFEQVFDDTTRRFHKTRMISECINAEGDGSVSNYVYCSIPAIARCLEAKCIAARTTDSKAISRAVEQFRLTHGQLVGDIQTLEEDYQEFLRYFEPMGRNPARSYCGRNEFRPEHRKTCPEDCEYYPKDGL